VGGGCSLRTSLHQFLTILRISSSTDTRTGEEMVKSVKAR